MSRVGMCVALVLLGGGGAQAAITTYSCKASGVAYRLILDDDAGTLVSVMQGKETVYGVRGIKREMGAPLKRGADCCHPTGQPFHPCFRPGRCSRRTGGHPVPMGEAFGPGWMGP